MVNIVNALCLNPLELFCIFGEEEITQQQSQSSSGGSIPFSSFVVPIVNYNIDKNYPIEHINRNCDKFLTPNITEISKTASLDELDKIALNQMKFEDKDGKITQLDLRKNHTVCHNLTVGFFAKYGLNSSIIFVNNTDVGVYINSYYNGTKGFVQRNKSFSEGYYLTQVLTCSNTTTQQVTNVSWNQNQTITYATNVVNCTHWQGNFSMDGDLSIRSKTRTINYTSLATYSQNGETHVGEVIAHYMFDDGQAKNLLNSSYDCTVDNSKVNFSGDINELDVEGLGGIATFDGIDDNGNSMACGNDFGNRINGTRNFTLGAWVKPFNDCQTTETILNGLDGFYPGFGLLDTITEPGCGFVANIYLDGSTTAENAQSNVNHVQLDTWNFVVFQYNGSDFCAFVNDTLITCDLSMTNPYGYLSGGSDNDIDGPLSIGYDDTSAGRNYLNGSINELFFCAPMCNRTALYEASRYNYTAWTTAQTDSGVSEELYNYSIGIDDISDAVADTTPPSGNLTTITNNSVYNATKILIGTLWDETGDIRLYINWTLNQTELSVSSGTNFTFITNLSNGTYLVNATNTDSSSNIGETPFFIFTIANNTGEAPVVPSAPPPPPSSTIRIYGQSTIVI